MVKKIRLNTLAPPAFLVARPARWGRLLALLVLLLGGRGAWAQTVNTYAATVSVGAYTPITGTLLTAATSSTTLDSYVGVIPANTIPFAFTYAGNNVATGAVNVSSNGFLTFGATTTSTTLYTPISSTAAFGGVIAPVALDLNARYSTTAGQNGELRYSVEGTAPNREFVVQWSNFRPYTTSTTNYLVWNFQVRLAETTNVVNIVYSPDSFVGTGQSGSGQVGLRGTANTDYKNFLINTANPWTAPAPGTASTSTAAFSTTLQPAVGQTYTFTPPAACVGTPTAGTAAAATASICVGSTSVLSISGNTVGAGITYQWQSASSSTGPFANISGATGTSYTASPTQTTYYQVVVTCANGGSPVAATSNVVAVTVALPTYAAFPATEGFENTWTSACSGTNNLPSASWRGTPVTGDNAWRRNDDGASASWSSPTSGVYTPGGSTAGGASSTYSARFHSYSASSGALGSLDYYVNLSTAGAKRLTFDYLNTSGTDKLSVFLSTDGGATFGTTALVEQVVAATWTQIAVDFATTSATCVLRFQATSDFGATDIGLDNVSLNLTPACAAPNSVTAVATGITTATATFYSPTATTGYQVTTTPATTTYTVAQPATGPATASLTGLALNTSYTVTAATLCVNGSTAATTSAPFVVNPYCNAPATLGGGNTGSITNLSIAGTPFSNATFGTPASGAYYTAYPASVTTAALQQGSPYSFTVNLSGSYSAVLWIDFDRNNTFDTGEGVQVVPTTGATTGTATFTVPTTAVLGTTGLRVRTRSAGSANAPANACTNFGSGETQDYAVTIVAAPPLDVQAAALVAPAASTTASCYTSTEAVTVTVRNVGTSALDFTTNPLTLNVNVTGAVTQTLTTTLSTNAANGGTPLASGATLTLTLPTTLNMTTVGTYTFAVSATVPGDGNPTNDVLAPAPTRTVAAPVVGTLAPATSSICLSGTATLTVTGAANGSIQYQSSTSATGTFTDIAGATSATYTTPVLTATTYYRAQVRCNTGVATSNVSTITVNNPLVASTNTPVSACAGSPATLTATASAGSQVRFFSAATGGTALATATAGTYTTPALTAATTYYVEAFAPATSVAGLADNSAANGTFTQSTATDYPLGFAVTQAGTLASVDVYPTATGTLTIRLYSVSGTQPAGAATAVAGSDVTITVTAAQVGTRVNIPLNYALAPGDYKLSNFAGGLGRYGTYTGTYPLTSADGALTVKGSYFSFGSTTYSNTTYNSFFNLTFTGECVGAAARTPIQVNVVQPATAAFPAATASTCGTSPYQLAGTVTGSATTGTYTSSGTGTFAPNATTLNATYTPSAADVAAGSVTITLTAAAAAPCAVSTATLALSISPAPVATFSYPATATYCAGSASTVAPTLGTGATAGTFTSTTGLTLNATTGAITLSTSTAGTYTVTNTVAASGACAAATATTTVTVSPAPVANAGAAAAICSGSLGQLGATPVAGLTYSWSPATGLSNAAIANPTVTLTNTTSAPTTQTYTLTVTNASGCTSTATAVVTVNPVPARPTLTPTYNGTVTTLTSSAATGNQFYFNGVAIAGATGQAYVVNGAPTTYGSYTVVVTNAFGCVSAASVPQVVTTTAQGIAGASLRVYPNPTPTGQLMLELSGFRTTTQLAVLDALGRVVATETLPATTGVVTHGLDLSRMAAGVYLLRLTNTDGVETRRLVRE